MILRSILELLAILILLYGIYKEEKLIIWERNAWQYIKAFFKVLKMEGKNYGKN